MREGWEYKKLGEVASSELGKTLNKSKDTGKLYPYICAVNVLWDMIDLTILKHAFFEKEEIDRYSVRKGDLLVCEGGDTGLVECGQTYCGGRAAWRNASWIR